MHLRRGEVGKGAGKRGGRGNCGWDVIYEIIIKKEKIRQEDGLAKAQAKTQVFLPPNVIQSSKHGIWAPVTENFFVHFHHAAS